MIKAGIIGGTGYVAGELLRCLVQHPEVTIDFIYSHSQPGQSVASVHDDLFAYDMEFTDRVNPNVDVVFLCLGHGHSVNFLKQNSFEANTKIIDLGNDFRLNKDAASTFGSFTYGLVELNKDQIKQARHIANPGCFATAIQLALLPLAASQLIKNEVHIHAVTGSTGAGQGLSATSHFSWRNNNLSIYKPFAHQHLAEITESITSLQPGFDKSINFIPVRGDFTRGIFASAYLDTDESADTLKSCYASYYKNAAFTKLTEQTVHLKQVVNTNYCLLQVERIDGKVLITSVIDNLLKGAAGQAIQNMNLMFGMEETTGLYFKSSFF